jgi:putative nucleotidyltransferase with HDIG domain
LGAIAAALGKKDRYTLDHAQRVAIYAMRLSQRIGLPAEAVEYIGLAGMLHDIGKLGLSRRVFTNTTVHLGGEMLREVRTHPTLGVSILKDIELLKPVLDCILLHHERLDGSGYPFGLKAEKIPLGAKILSVVDCFDAITTDRPYQKRKSIAEACKILRQSSGKSLSSDLVDAFIDEILENGIITA